ncbi:MAG: DUF2029 domain-containing protein [Anaerolineae bacterium]|nr:DUF2029 domain-containing protein [Anaerolineae bacterium]
MKTRVLLGVLAALLVFGAAVVITHNVLTRPYPGHNDFMSRWEGSRSFWIDGLNPYGELASLNIQYAIYGRPVVEGEDPGYFAYPFYTLFVVWPLVYVDYAWASAVWMVLLQACLIGGLFLLLDAFRWRPRPWLLSVLLLWSLVFYFPARGLILGQPGLLVYFLEMYAIWALLKGHDRWGGAALALSTLKPQMGFLIVPFLVLWALRERRWRFVGAFGVAMLGLLAASFALLPSWLGDWLAQLGLYPSYTAFGSPVWIITSYYLGLGSWAELLGSGLLFVLMLWSWYDVLLRRRGERFLWAAALTLTVTHLIAPRTATPHYAVFMLPLVFYGWQITRRYPRQASAAILLMLALLLIVPWVHFVQTVQGEFEHPTLYLPLPFIILALLLSTRRWWWESVVR